MTKIYVLRCPTAKSVEVAMHFPVPSKELESGLTIHQALVLSGVAKESRVPASLVESEVRDAVKAGRVVELVETFNFTMLNPSLWQLKSSLGVFYRSKSIEVERMVESLRFFGSKIG